jgi:rubrerythrin
MRSIVTLGLATFSALTLMLPTSASASVTLDHLQEAYNGESNASARYLEFAKKADAEGYASVASLFRAAAKAEEIHAANHAVVITKLGAKPTAAVKLPEIKSTADNLKAAVEGESYERDKMYPQFIKDARAAGDADAVRTFNFALAAEGEHATLYSGASAKLSTLKGGQGVTYYVCSVCGKTVAKVDFAKCPVCFSPKDKYATVS